MDIESQVHSQFFGKASIETYPICKQCGKNMMRKFDSYGEYFVCFRYKGCFERVAGRNYSKYYKKQFNDGLLGQYKHKAHCIFDKLWKEKGISRKDSYKILQKIMRLPESEAHISKFTIKQCKFLMRELKILGDAIFVLQE